MSTFPVRSQPDGNHGWRAARRGFTLIEVLIVVAIVALLAGLVIPRVASPVQSAVDSVRLNNLRLAQACLSAYQIAHGGLLPTIQGNGLPQLSSYTNVQGEIGSPGPDYPCAPYWSQMPVNPADGSNSVSSVLTPGQPPSGPAGNLGGWQYDQTTGTIWPNDALYYTQ